MELMEVAVRVLMETVRERIRRLSGKICTRGVCARREIEGYPSFIIPSVEFKAFRYHHSKHGPEQYIRHRQASRYIFLLIHLRAR